MPKKTNKAKKAKSVETLETLELKPPKWVYIVFPIGTIYKVPGAKIQEHFYANPHTDKQMLPPTKTEELADYMKSQMTWFDLKDFVIMIHRTVTLDPQSLFEHSIIAKDAQAIGVAEE